MNIFFLDANPYLAAISHCDKHVVKMILEYAQMLSTAHRVLDGTPEYVVVNNRRKLVYKLNDHRDDILYKAAYINHPSTVWVRSSHHNYLYMLELFQYCCSEYVHRYNKNHTTCIKLEETLRCLPQNIGRDVDFTPPPQLVSDNCKHPDTVIAYRNSYMLDKSNKFKLVWTNRKVPSWYKI